MLLEQKQYKQSIGYFEQATKINPGHAAAHNNWGIALANIDRIDQPIEHFEIAVRLQPDNPSYQHNLSRAQALRQKKKEIDEKGSIDG
jgi:tetratricopeptide (TPR) repeat protein